MCSKLKWIRLILWVALAWISTTGLSAQGIKKFSNDPDVFLTELSVFFASDSRMTKNEVKAEIDTFAGFWLSGAIDKDQQSAVISTCNSMLKHKMNANTHFRPYLEVVKVMGESSQSRESFLKWDTTLKFLAQKNINRFLTYLQGTELLLTEGILYKSKGVTWKSSSMDFVIDLEGDKPVVLFSSLDLIAYANNDSSIIHQTSGKYYPIDERFVGNKGKVTWERAGFQADQVYADFLNYQIDLTYSRYRVDSVNFYRKDLFAAPMSGQLIEHVQLYRSVDDASYPQFFSYDSDYEIRNIFPGVDYKGGYSLRGNKMSGTGSVTEKAILVFKRNGLPFITVRSNSFLMRDDRISAEVVEAVIYLEEDSIYHPGLQMRYTDDNKILSLYRGSEGISLSPFLDTYHGFDLYVEEVAWKLDGNRMVFKSMEGTGNVGDALFESTEYFSLARYDRIQGMEQEHPLSVIRRFCFSFSTREFTLEEFSRYMKFDPVQIKMYLLNLSTMGFLYYDLDQDYIRVNERVFRYVNARNAKVDYDIIQIYSEVVGIENAYMSLLDFSMVINGVAQVMLSDSQQVMIYPSENKITLKKNHDMVFAGRVHAGLFDFYGKNFYFAYDKFEIALPVIDSLSFSVRGFDKDPSGWAPLRRVKTVIQDVNGNIIVDRHDNKSGLASLSEYPIFNCKEYSFAYYNDSKIFGGAYPRENFYYRLNPFTIDSLDNFETAGLRFQGVFSSAGIFPDLYDDLRVMPDYSLGLVSQAPNGIMAYGGKSRFFNKISLSNEGLRGDGRLEYSSAKCLSDDFIFFPTSAQARLKSIDVASTAGNPGFADAQGENIDMTYRPYQDQMVVTTVVKPFSLYKDFAGMRGSLTISSTQMSGSGTLSVMDAEIDSRKFVLGQIIGEADTCDFRLKATYAGYKLGEGDTEGYELMTYNYHSKIDFGKKHGEFRSNGGVSRVMFTLNQYMSYIDRFDWDMNSDKIELYNEQGSNLDLVDALPIKEQVDAKLIGAEFISTHPRQDSLRFFAKSASYSRKDNIITTKGVPFIKVADAAIFPADGVVSIFRNAEMMPLLKAQILANVDAKYHQMFDASVTIRGKLSYDGSAMYNFTDATGLKQPVTFTKVGVNSVLETFAEGYVSDSSGFRLSPYFDFYGKIGLLAPEQFLTFDGGARIKHTCNERDRQWLKFTAIIDPAKVEIPVSESPSSTSFDDLYASIMSTSDSVRVYSAFVEKNLRGTDKSFISANGFLIFDEKSGEYRIGSKDKLADRANPGNFLSLNTKTCNTEASGKMDMGTDFGQVKIDMFGEGMLFAEFDSIQFNLAMLVDFFFNEKALEVLINDLQADARLGGVDLQSEVLNQAMMDILGKDPTSKLLEGARLYGSFGKIPTELSKTLVLSDIAMHFDTRRKSYISEGPISIVNINNREINKAVQGRIEILRTRSDDEFTIYLELNANTWYFFSYERGRMMALSSNEAFNTAIRDTKPEKRRQETSSGQTPYVYMLTTVRAQKAFTRKYGDSVD